MKPQLTLSSLSIDDRVYLDLPEPGKPAPAVLIAKIGAGSKPDPNQILLWYGEGAHKFKSVFQALRVDRYIFEKDSGSGNYVIIPDSQSCRGLVRKIE